MTPIVRHVLGADRRAAQRLIAELHYSGSTGNQGRLYAAIADGQPIGACLLGTTLSESSERSIIAAGYQCVLMKRLVAAEDCAMPESQLMRASMRALADVIGPYLCISYADPVARDARSGKSLLGGVYLAAGLFLAGFTSQPRFAVVDDGGLLRSTRQGKRTLGRRTAPRAGDTWQGRIVTRDWQIVRIPPARIWITPVTPWRWEGKATTQAQRKKWYLDYWRHLNPARRVAAQRWIDTREWRRLLDVATVDEIGPPRQERAHQLLARAWWPAALMTRTAGPAWVPQVEQGQLFEWVDVAGEITAGRRYWPREAADDLC